MKLIILGAPGAGKGTQAEVISEKLGIPVIGTGNLIREIMKSGTPAGLKAKELVDQGGLVPDEIVIEMLRDRIKGPDCKKGFILDGFPRNVAQARALDQMGIVVERVIDLEVSDQKIIERLVGRRICGDCGASYHLVHKPPIEEGTCDKCGGPITTRVDDDPDTVKERLRIYHDQTEPLKDYYHAAGKLIVVEGQDEIMETTKLTLAALEAETV